MLMQPGFSFRHPLASQAAPYVMLQVLPCLPLAGWDGDPRTANLGNSCRVEMREFTGWRGLGGRAKNRAIILYCSAVCAPAGRSRRRIY